MEGSSRTFEIDYSQFIYEDDEQLMMNKNNSVNDDADHCWKTVTYKKKKSKKHQPSSSVDNLNDVFRSIELLAEERRKRMLLAQKGVVVDDDENSGGDVGADDEEKEVGAVAENDDGEVKKKKKKKKTKKPKVTVSEAASQIDSSELGVFLADISVSYETQQDIQLMRFADYFGGSFAKVSGSQFPWMKILKESSVAKMVDIPISQISDDVLETSMNWLYHKSSEALASFVMWSLNNLLSEFDHLHQGQAAAKLNKMPPAKSQVAIFLVLAMVLRHKPQVLTSLLPLLKENPKYQGQDKLNLAVWVITQATEGDMAVGLFMWVHFLLPMLCSNESNDHNPQNTDLVLQVAERIIALPKSGNILVNSAVRKGDRLLPPSALEVLMRFTFEADPAHLMSTARFKAIYPTLKGVALAAPARSKAMKQLTQQIAPFALKATGEGVPELAKEGADLFILCLTQNPDCYHQWDGLYLENTEASVAILKKLSDEWAVFASKLSAYDSLMATLKNFMLKNEKGLASEGSADHKAILKDGQKHCKKLLSRLSRGNGCVKVSVVVAMAIAISATYLAYNDGVSQFLLN